MSKLLCCLFLLTAFVAQAQKIPNGDFKKWGNEYDKCPTGWGCNNDADCAGKITMADKIKGGAKLTVMHCFDPKKDDRSNNVSLNYDDLSARIAKGKKVKMVFVYSYKPMGNDRAYVKIDIDVEETLDKQPMFVYNDAETGFLPVAEKAIFTCQLNFNPGEVKNYVAPQNMNAGSIRTTFGIMEADGASDVHKGTTLVIHEVKFVME